MTSHASYEGEGQFSPDFDLSQIFIGREQQMDLFDWYLNRWKRLMAVTPPVRDDPVVIAPNPNNKIQGLVVLLYGRGGFGKSTLLKHYRDRVLRDSKRFVVSEIVDWEFASEGKRSLFNLAPGQEIDAPGYFAFLQSQLAAALNKRPDEFRDYQVAVRDVEAARKQAHSVLDSLGKDNRSTSLRVLAGPAAMTLLRWIAPRVGQALDSLKVTEKIEEVLGKGAEISAEQLTHAYSKLHNELGHKLDDYLGSALRLGLALGRDLSRLARNFPLLIFFDTYEEIDEADHLLRIVMGAAGVRVGWAIAGRDNLWAGMEQRTRSQDVEYGYKEIVPADRRLGVNFNDGGVGTFTISDVVDYFAQLHENAQYDPPLPRITEEKAAQILEVTQGVPLAVKIAAGLYLETTDLEVITEKAEGKREIVEEMVRRYLLHTRADQSERARVYGLALLRRADESRPVAAALDLTPKQARIGYEAELSRLQRRYSFIFSGKRQPSLQKEVRHFLRLWLLERRDQQEIIDINERLKEAHETALKELEERGQYSSLRERLEEDEWVGIYLDLVEQQFWLNPKEGVRYSLPFMVAAVLYRRDGNQEAATVGNFFECCMEGSYGNWWKWATQSLKYTTPSYLFHASRNLHRKMSWAAQRRGFTRSVGLPYEEITELEGLAKLANQKFPAFPLPQSDYRGELEAIMWWQLGEIYLWKDDDKALEWYEKALSLLTQQIEVREAAAQAYYNVALKLYGEKKHSERLSLLNKAIELKPDYDLAYYSRGNVYNDLKEYQKAIADYDRAIALDPLAFVYYGRGDVYSDLKEYQQAIADFDCATELDPAFPLPYNARGQVYFHLKEYQQAIADFDRAIELDPELDPKLASPYFNRGQVYFHLEEYQRAIADYDHALELAPRYALAYYNRGLAYLWLKNTQQARVDFSRGWKLNRRFLAAPWLAEWAGMGKERVGTETAERLEVIAAVDPQHYGAYICRGVGVSLRDRLKEGLAEIEAAIILEPEKWHAYFWKGMICADLGQNQTAVEAIGKALDLDLPPVLLTPLYWLKKDRPDFFRDYAAPLLAQYSI